MRIDLMRHALIAKLAAVVLLALCLIQWNARASQPINISAAQTTGTFTLTFNGATLGLARGQTLRLTGSNGNEPGSRGGSDPVRALATLYDAHGNPSLRAPKWKSPPVNFARLISTATIFTWQANPAPAVPRCACRFGTGSSHLIPAGEFHSFDFNRSDLPLAGEPGSSPYGDTHTSAVGLEIKTQPRTG